MSAERFGPWDKNLQMPIEPIREADQKHLESIKWAVENGRLTGDTEAAIIVFPGPKASQE